MKKNTKRVLAAVLAVIMLALMLIPIKLDYNDGGTVAYSAVLWQVELPHRIIVEENGQIGYLVGARVTLLCGLITVYDDTYIRMEP